MHRCSISASTQLNLTAGAVGAAGAAREQPSDSLGVSVTLLDGIYKFPGTREAGTTEDRDQKAKMNKERRVEVVLVFFVWDLQRPACERAVKERGGPSSSYILCSFVFFDVMTPTKVFFYFFLFFYCYRTQSAVKVGIDAFRLSQEK